MTQNSEKLSLSVPVESKALNDAFKLLPYFEMDLPAYEFKIENQPDLFLITGNAADLKAEIKKPARFGMIVDEVLRLRDQQAQSLRDKKIRLGQDLFDPRDMILQRDGKKIELTEKEVAVLQLLLQNAPDAVSREDLLQSVWGYHPDVTTHTVETHLWRLRQKIEIDPANPQIVVTTPEGYALGVEVRGEM